MGEKRQMKEEICQAGDAANQIKEEIGQTGVAEQLAQEAGQSTE